MKKLWKTRLSETPPQLGVIGAERAVLNFQRSFFELFNELSCDFLVSLSTISSARGLEWSSADSVLRAAAACLRFFVVLLWGAEFTAWAQQDAASPPAESAVPAVPVSQAAVPSGKNADSEKAAPSTAPASPAATANDNTSQLKLGSGDLLEVSVYNVPELTTKARIGNAGDVYLPLIDYVHVGGLTVDEAQALIQKRLEDGGFVRNAHVSIFVDESASQGVTILGEVAKPGLYPALGDRKLYDMISLAGGFTAAAGRKSKHHPAEQLRADRSL